MVSMLPDELYLCIDGGGTSLDLRIFSRDGWSVSAVGPCCNVQTIGYETAMELIAKTVRSALGRTTIPRFKRVWLALAGVQSRAESDVLEPLARALLGDECQLRISNDGHLLAAPLLSEGSELRRAITVVAGTGSVLSSFERTDDHQLVCTGMRGGWGYLLGDEGSAYAIGKAALRSVLYHAERGLPFIELHEQVLAAWGSSMSTLIEGMYDIRVDEGVRKTRVAKLTTLVNSYAYDQDAARDAESVLLAKTIVTAASAELQESVLDLLRSNGWNARDVLLSLGGGVWTQRGYRALLVAGLQAKGETFGRVDVIDKPVEAGAKALLD